MKIILMLFIPVIDETHTIADLAPGRLLDLIAENKKLNHIGKYK